MAKGHSKTAVAMSTSKVISEMRCKMIAAVISPDEVSLKTEHDLVELTYPVNLRYVPSCFRLFLIL